MFNFQLLKRSILNSSYKYLICMILIISGVYISVFAYNPDFVLNKADADFVFKELLKILMLCYTIKLISMSKSGFLVGSVVLVYTGMSVGAYLMFVLNNMSVFKLVLSVIPITVKLVGIVTVYSDMFLFEQRENIKKLIAGGILYFSGDVLLAVML